MSASDPMGKLGEGSLVADQRFMSDILTP